MDELREEWEEGGRESWREREMEGGRLTTLLELEGTWTESLSVQGLSSSSMKGAWGREIFTHSESIN